ALRGGGRAPRGGAAAADRAVDATPPEAERRLDAAAPAAQENTWASACLARATGRLWDDASTLASAVKIWESIGARFERACTLLLLPSRLNSAWPSLTRPGRSRRVQARSNRRSAEPTSELQSLNNLL